MEHEHAAGRHDHEHDHEELADLLDLDAAVLGRYLDDLLDWAGALAPASTCTVVDLGAGTGVGSLALARRFPAADVVAVDRSPAMLDRIAAAAGGVGARVRTVPADLEEGWPAAAGRADVAWASSSLHEVADPDALLRGVGSALAPGGLLVVVEMDALPRFLPDDVAPGLEERVTAALTEAGWNAHPDWRPNLERAGFDVVEQRAFPARSEVDPALTARYARAWLGHVRRGLDGRASAADLHALDRLLADTGPDAVLDRRDLVVRGSRTAWAARITPDRPEEDPR
jgi:SAM-dependent methyltransferase